MQIKQDEDEAEYGSWEFTAQDVLEEQRKLLAPRAPEDIWPHWSKGVPTKLRRTFYSPAFIKNGVRHEGRPSCDTLELKWNRPRALSELKKNYNLLPSNSAKSEWSGVYRIFLADTAIDRLCGKDPTGTLYFGLAGTGPKNWSILRNRLMAAVKHDHHATRQWGWNAAITQTFPGASLMVEWAYTGMRSRSDHGGELVTVLLSGFLRRISTAK
jgi:hypothetical protein